MTVNNSLPPVKLPEQLSLVPTFQHTCHNQVQLHTMHVESAEVVRLTLVLSGGTSVQHKPFCGATTMSMLSEGSQNHTAQQIAEKLDYYGIYFNNTTDRDYAYVTIAALSKFLPQALELLEDMLLRPLFTPQELTLYRGKKRQAQKINEAKPAHQAQAAFSNRLYGPQHPYGRIATYRDYDNLTPEDLRQYYDQNIHCDDMFAVASGNITPQTHTLLTQFIEKIPHRNSTIKPTTVKFPEPQQTLPLEHRIDRPEQTQCCIRMGCTTIDKSHPDYIPFQLLSMVLGGYFGSRLMQNLREDKGYTYGVYCGLVNLRHCTHFIIATDTGVEHHQDAIVQIHTEIERLQNKEITPKELTAAKNMIIGEIMRLIDGPFGIADIAIENIQSQKSHNYLNEFLATIATTTATDLQKIARRYLDPQAMTTIIG